MTTSSPAILVVDDDQGVREMLALMLRSSGYRVLIAQDGKGALSLLDHSVDLVLTDLVMPGLDGVALATKVLESQPQTRIVLMSGSGSALARAEAAKLPLLRKPFLVRELLEVVGATISSS